MKERFWPWKTILRLESEVESLTARNKSMRERIEKHEREAQATAKHVRKMASIIAIKGGILG